MIVVFIHSIVSSSKDLPKFFQVLFFNSFIHLPPPPPLGLTDR